MTKKLTSLILALVMCLTLCVPAMAASTAAESQIQTEIQAEKDLIFREVYRQLEEQNALSLFDIYKELLAVEIERNIRAQYELDAPRAGTTQTTLLKGGVVGYDSSLGATVLSTYMTNEQYANGLNPIVDVGGSFIINQFLKWAGKTFAADNAYYISLIGGWGLVFESVMLLKGINDALAQRAVINAGGYAHVMNVSDGIEQGSVVLGWSNHPNVTIPSGATGIHVLSFH